MLTDSEISIEEMQRMVRDGCICAVCQSHLNIAWGGYIGLNNYILRCSRDVHHKGITRHDEKEEKKYKEAFSMDSTALMAMGETKMLARVEMARFPQELTLSEKKLLAQVAITYGFDPLMGEITIYQGRPWVSIDGRYRKAQETGQLDGVETRPATKQERQDWQIPDGDFFFRTEVWIKSSSRPFVAWGRVNQVEANVPAGKTAFLPVQKNPQRMAEKRAEAQALRKAFHIPLPSVEDIGAPDYDIETTARVIDTETGEIKGDPIGKAAKKKIKEEEREAQPKPGPTQGDAETSPDATESITEPVEKEMSGRLPVEKGEPATFTVDDLYAALIAAKPALKNIETAKNFLMVKLQIAKSLIEQEPVKVWEEVRQLL